MTYCADCWWYSVNVYEREATPIRRRDWLHQCMYPQVDAALTPRDCPKFLQSGARVQPSAGGSRDD